MKRYIIWILLIVFIISCGKKDVRYYAGIVVDSTGAPVAQANVSIVYRQGASNIVDGADEIHKLALTEPDGTFSSQFTLRKKEYIKYFIISSPLPNSITIRTYEYNNASNTTMRIVLQ